MNVWLCGYNGFNQILANYVNENPAVVSSPVLVELNYVCHSLDNSDRFDGTSEVLGAADNRGSQHNHEVITDVAIGWSKICLIGLNGRLYMPAGSEIIQARLGKFLNEYSNNVESISLGWTTSCVAVSGSSECFVWNEKDSSPCRIDLPEASVKCGESITGVTTNEVTVFVTTSGRRLLSADLRRTAETSNLLFQPLLPEFHIRTVSCGKHHILILSMIGVVFSCGNGGQGQLGHGSVEPKIPPTVVEALEGVTVSNIAAGGWHSLAVTDSGDLYAWGWNERGQLGLPSENVSGKQKKGEKLAPTDGAPYNDTKRCLKLGSNATEAESDEANFASAADLEDDEDTSLPPYVNVLTLPHVVDFAGVADDMQVVKVAAGSRHTVALLENGHVFTWGWNDYGQLGLGDTASRDSPTAVALFADDSFRISNVFAGWWNTVFVAE